MADVSAVTAQDGTYTETEIDTQWGIDLGSVVCWNPTYGRGPGYEQYFTRESALAQIAVSGTGTLVTRTVTTIVIESPWTPA